MPVPALTLDLGRVIESVRSLCGAAIRRLMCLQQACSAEFCSAKRKHSQAVGCRHASGHALPSWCGCSSLANQTLGTLNLTSGNLGDRECAAALWAAVQRLTREQLACGLLQLLADLEQQASRATSCPEVLGLPGVSLNSRASRLKYRA